MPPRKMTATVSYKLRIKEALRRRIEQAAKKRGVSLNYEMANRLEQSFDREHLFDMAAVASFFNDLGERVSDQFHELNKQGDLLRAIEPLLKQIDEGKDTSAAAAKVKAEIAGIDAMARAGVRQMHTTGKVVDALTLKRAARRAGQEPDK